MKSKNWKVSMKETIGFLKKLITHWQKMAPPELLA
jgi:hypothetical protein